MIRRATLADLPVIESLLIAAKRRSEFVTVKIEFERARKIIRTCISSPKGFAYVAEHDGKITGVLLGVADHYWYSVERFATDFAFYSKRRGDGRELLTRFLEWAASKGATPLLGQSSGRHGPGIHKLYTSMGLFPIGTLYMGEKPIQVRLPEVASA